MTQKLNIAAFQPITYAHGAGPRSALWVQGCALQCPGCTNEYMNSFTEQVILSVEQIVQLLLLVVEQGSTGITLMGGEPMLQAPQLAEVIQKVREKVPDYTVIAFSGYTLKTLKKSPHWLTHYGQLHDVADVLIDGPYKEKMPDAEYIRGSTNQEIHFVTERLALEDLRRLLGSEFIVSADGSIIQSGFSQQEMLTRTNS